MSWNDIAAWAIVIAAFGWTAKTLIVAAWASRDRRK